MRYPVEKPIDFATTEKGTACTFKVPTNDRNKKIQSVYILVLTWRNKRAIQASKATTKATSGNINEAFKR